MYENIKVGVLDILFQQKGLSVVPSVCPSVRLALQKQFTESKTVVKLSPEISFTGFSTLIMTVDKIVKLSGYDRVLPTAENH